MADELAWMRSLKVYGMCGVVAVLLGYLLATPMSLMSLVLIPLVLMPVLFPLYLRWHHLVLVAAWHSAFVIFFSPGQLGLWTVLVFGTLLVAVLRYAMTKQPAFIQVPSVATPLILLALVVAITMAARGDFGSRVLGSGTWGTKRYVWVFAAIAGFFALTSERIPAHRVRLYAALFFLSLGTAAISDAAYAAGPSFYSLFLLVSPQIASLQAITAATFDRLTGVSWAGMGLCYYLLLRYGIRGLCDVRRFWRFVLFGAAFALTTLGGYRADLILLFLLFTFQFGFEGLLRSHLFPLVLGGGLLAAVFVVGFVDRLPLAAQRTLSFLPLKVDPIARADAQSTLDWRLEMWRVVFPEVPHYLLSGKGYGFDGTDYFLTQEAMRRGFYSSYEDTLITGNYHNGILTLMIPFGIWGMICFLWFCWAAFKVLLANYRHSPPDLRMVNTFLLGYFCARLVFYLVFYGQFDLDLMEFTGTVGLSVALNGGVLRPATRPVVEEVAVPMLAETVPVG